jgi:hypothetical protein
MKNNKKPLFSACNSYLSLYLRAASMSRFFSCFRRGGTTWYTTRRVQQIVKLYAEQAGVNATPHTFWHQAITWLSRHSSLADAAERLTY